VRDFGVGYPVTTLRIKEKLKREKMKRTQDDRQPIGTSPLRGPGRVG